ncbi:MAG: class I adenylate-forming enzyme family protein [Bacteroidales bacterium]
MHIEKVGANLDLVHCISLLQLCTSRIKMMTLTEILESSYKKYPEKTAIFYKEKQIPYKQVYHQSRSLAAFLIDKGLRKGDRVGLIVKKNPDAIIAFLGIAQAGGVFYSVDYNQPDDSIQYTIDLTRPSFLVISSEFHDSLKTLNLRKHDTKVIIIGEESSDHFTWQEAISFESKLGFDVKIENHDPVYLNFTSGSTGKPKGAVTTHDNLYWNTKSVVETFKFTHDDIHLCGFPIFTHPHELFYRAFYTGGSLVLTDDFLPKTVTSAVVKHKVTCLMAISLIYENLLRYQSTATALSTLRVAESAGMHVDSDLIKSFKEKFNVNITAAWGSTETAGIALSNPIEGGKLDSIGIPCPYYETRIVDENGNDVDVNTIGEMIIKGRANITAYFDNEKESENLIKNGWLHTGDMVKKDPEGYFYFISRKSRMIKVAGWKVYPSEIEEILASHPAVVECAVTKIYDPTLGELPKAVVVLQDKSAVSPGELRRYCSQRTAKYKVPAVVEFVNALPKAPSGKILYQNL